MTFIILFMKKYLLLSLLLFSLPVLYAQNNGITFLNGSLKDALSKAQSRDGSPSLVFLDCYTSWCGPCKRMATQLFTQPKAGDFFNRNFVNIKIDMEKGEGIELAKKYAVSMYPTFLILDRNGEEIGRLMGASLTLEDFIERVKDAMDLRNSAGYLKKQYDSTKSYTIALKYLDACSRSNKTAEIRSFITGHFAQFSEYEKTNHSIWNHLILSITDPDSEILRYITENRSYTDQMIGKEKTGVSLIRAYRNILSSYLSGKIELSGEQADVIRKEIQMIDSGDNYSNIIADVARALAHTNLTEVETTINPSRLAGILTHTETLRLENLLLKTRRLPEKIMKEYYLHKKQLLEKQLLEIKKKI